VVLEVREMTDESRYTLEEAHEKFAKMFNGRVWELLEKTNRSVEDDEELLLAQHASTYHWRHVGTVTHEQRSQWLYARIYAVLDDPDKSLSYALRCLEITQSNPAYMQDFDIAYAYEAAARMHALNGQLEVAREYFAQAEKAGEAIEDPEDRKIFMGDFKSGNWYGVK
jgi:tetratricopeptide (TPR) repeat protein